MRRNLAATAVAYLILLSITQAATAGVVVLASDEDFALICHVDPWVGNEWFCGPFRNDFVGWTPFGAVGLATHPVSRHMYAVFDTDEAFHRLVRFEPQTFAAYDIGNIGELITGLAFDAAGTLYGVSSDDVAGTTDSVFTIDTTTAVATKITDLPAPDGIGDTIAFNPDDGKLYHWGGYTTQSFNRLNLATMMWENIGVPAGWPAGVAIRSFTYDSERGLFIGHREDEFFTVQEFFTITASGTHGALAQTSFRYRGIAIYDDPPLPVPAAPASGRHMYGVDPNLNIISQMDPATGNDIAAIGVTTGGNLLSGFNGLATDPTTGELYAIARTDPFDASIRLLVKVNPLTGIATLVGDTGRTIASIAITDAGVIYGVTGDGAFPASTLYTLDKMTAAATEVLPLSFNGGGEAIAFNSKDGKIYRFSGNTSIESIDPVTLDVTSIPVSGDMAAAGTPASATYDSVNDQLLVFAFQGPIGTHTYYSATAAGATTNILVGSLNRKGMAFSLPAFTGIVALPDISTNGIPEVGVAVPGSTRVHVRDGATDALLSDLNFGDDPAFDMTVVPDLNGDGNPEIAVLGLRPSGQIRVLIKDSASGVTTGNAFYGDQYSGIEMAVVPDFSGNGLAELAVLGQEAGTDKVRVMIRDAATDTGIKSIFLGNRMIAYNVTAVADASGNGIPEIATMGVVKTSNQIMTPVRDASTAALHQTVFWANQYEPVKTLSIADIDASGDAELVSLGMDPNTQAVRLQIRDVSTRTPITTVFLGSANTALDMAVIDDTDLNGFPDVAVLLRTGTNTGLVRVYDSSSGALLKQVFYNSLSSPVGLAALADYSGNGAMELAVLGQSAGLRQVQIKDSVTGNFVNTIDFP